MAPPTYENESYRTRGRHPVFAHNMEILKEKRLIAFDEPVD